MQLEPNLVFNGNAQDALEHHRDALGGDMDCPPARGSVTAGDNFSIGIQSSDKYGIKWMLSLARES
jgi:uncharacterized glyoxalase superfamily protein PhnB